MPPTGSALSRNPHVCASCSSLADGAEEAEPVDLSYISPDDTLVCESPLQDRRAA